MSKPAAYPRVIPVGETAFTIEFGNIIDTVLNAQVLALDAYLQAHPITGIIETVPTYRSLLVLYDPNCASPFDLQTHLREIAGKVVEVEQTSSDFSSSHLVEIPVHYGGDWGPDIADVADYTNLSTQDVIRKHTEPEYQVAMLGFAPGFTYLLGLPAELSTPRLATPRMHLPPGSVGIAGSQTGLYALDTPGGWRIIGRTTLTLIDPDRDPPFLLQAGDRVRFIVEE